MSKRAHINMETKLAAALLQHLRFDDEKKELVPLISYEESKTLTARQIISRFHLDHGIPHAHGGPDEPWNLTFRAVEDHRKKTAKHDVPRMKKGDRIARANDEHVRRLLAKDRGEPKPPSRWPSRKIKSRGFERRA
jgi:hypothetical protein